MNKEKLFSFATSGIAATALAMIALISMKSLFEMLSFTSGGAWILGTSVALVPAFFLNRFLTKAYNETCDVNDANEFSSFTGTLATVSLAIIGGLWLGFAGTIGNEALSTGIRETGSAVGLLQPLSVKSAASDGEETGEKAKGFLQSLMDGISQSGSEMSAKTVPETNAQTIPQTNAQTIPQTTAQTIPQTTAQTIPQTTAQTIPEMIKNSGSGNVTIFY
jgi:putative flippase GtrA